MSEQSIYSVGYGGGFDAYIVWPYIKALVQDAGTLPLLIHIGPELSEPDGRSGLHKDPDIRFIVVNDIPTSSAMPDHIQKFKHDLIRDLTQGQLLPEVLNNPMLVFQFTKLVDTFFWKLGLLSILTPFVGIKIAIVHDKQGPGC